MLDAAIAAVISPVPDCVPPGIVRTIQVGKLAELINKRICTTVGRVNEEQVRPLLDFIATKRIYILAEFESGGHKLIQLADELNALFRSKVTDSNQLRCAYCGTESVADGISRTLYCPKCQQ